MTGTSSTRPVLVVDDHALVAQSLTLALCARGFEAVRAPRVETASVLALAWEMKPVLVLLDLDLGDGLDGARLIPDLTAMGSRVLVLTGSTDEFLVATAVVAGATGWLSKTVPFEELLATAETAADGQAVLDEVGRRRLVEHYREGCAERAELHARLGALSRRERAVLHRLADGQQADAIARDLYVSINTVRTQIRSILTKLDVTSQLAAAAMARRAADLGLSELVRN